MFYGLVASVLIGLAIAKVPTNIEFCGRRNPKLNECANRSSLALLPQILDGVPEWDLPVIDPFYVPEIIVANEDSFRANVKDIKITGIRHGINVVHLNVDFPNKTISLVCHFPQMRIDAEYDGITRIILPLVGKGPINIDARDVTTNITLKMSVVERSGSTYIFFNEMKLKVDIKDYTVKFTLRNNPDSTLQEAINSALSDRQSGLLESILPSIEMEVSTIILTSINQITKHFTLEEFFPDTE